MKVPTFLPLVGIILLSASVFAQFNSGSTGADGALDLSSCPTSVCEVQLPESGVLNYTTVNIPGGKELRFKRNARNTPVYLLAQGDITIGGIVSVDQPRLVNTSSHQREPGPGGFFGGGQNQNGFGPGGGSNPTPLDGRWVGPLTLAPIVGGSGGAGSTTGSGCGGAGAIVIASSTMIQTVGTGSSIRARGMTTSPCTARRGSGGAIRLVADTISIAGSLQATGTNQGIIRLESNSLTLTGTSTPLAIQSTINPVVVNPVVPMLIISSIGGVSIPAYSGARFDTIDVMLPNQLVDPIPVAIGAQNIPTGTEVKVGFVSGSPNATSTPCSLEGAFVSSSCTATISNLDRIGGTYLIATAAFDPPASAAAFNPKGKDHVARVKLESVYGGTQKYVFLRVDGSVIEPSRLSKKFLQEFGM